jgi:hypothetical protein
MTHAYSKQDITSHILEMGLKNYIFYPKFLYHLKNKAFMASTEIAKANNNLFKIME